MTTRLSRLAIASALAVASALLTAPAPALSAARHASTSRGRRRGPARRRAATGRLGPLADRRRGRRARRARGLARSPRRLRPRSPHRDGALRRPAGRHADRPVVPAGHGRRHGLGPPQRARVGAGPPGPPHVSPPARLRRHRRHAPPGLDTVGQRTRGLRQRVARLRHGRRSLDQRQRLARARARPGRGERAGDRPRPGAGTRRRTRCGARTTAPRSCTSTAAARSWRGVPTR